MKRAQARALCRAGKTYKEIAKEIHVSTATVSSWCRDIAQQRRSEQIMQRYIPKPVMGVK